MSKTQSTPDPISVVFDATRRLGEVLEEIAALPEKYQVRFMAILRAMTDSFLDAPMPELAPLAIPSEAQTGGELVGESELVLQRIEAFFDARGNKPATVAEISNGASVPYHTLRNYLQKRHRSKFGRVPTGPGKPGLWRMMQPSESAMRGPDKRRRTSEEEMRADGL